MKTKLSIKNFRIFDENGVTFEINPITILTGKNSSGKSSAVKAIFLLNDFLKQIKKAIENDTPIQIEDYKLDFRSYPNNLLGRFDKVIHDGSPRRLFTMEYTVYSLMLSKDVVVQFVFSADENDELNNAYLETLSMRTEDGIFYYSGKGQSYCNLNIIKKDYISFVITEFLVHEYSVINSNYDIDGSISQKDRDIKVKEITDSLSCVDKQRKEDIMRYVRFSKHHESIIHDINADITAMEEIKNKESIFSIPFVDELSCMPKNEIDEAISFADKTPQYFIFASHKIINDFKESPFENFAQYFADYESKSFENKSCDVKIVDKSESRAHMLSAQDIILQQDYLSYNPYFKGTRFFVFDKELGVVEKDEASRQIEIQKRIEEWENRPISFDMVYEVVMAWNRSFAPYRKGVYSYHKDKASHTSFNVLKRFAELLVQEVACPDWTGNMSYVSSARVDVNRLYTLDSRDDFSLLLQNYFEKKRLFLDHKNSNKHIDTKVYKVNSFMNRWIEKFDVGKAISLDADKDGLGIQIRLHKSDGDEGRILADEGYGITQLVSILLQIETAILSAKGEKVNRFWALEELDHYKFDQFHYEINTIAIEEPEIHLHPQYQSLLAEMFLEAYEKYNIHFIIETHSEYLIRKVQVIVAQHNYKNEEDMNKESPFKVYYVPRGEKPYEMTFNIDGAFKNEFGKGFFDEAENLAFEIL